MIVKILFRSNYKIEKNYILKPLRFLNNFLEFFPLTVDVIILPQSLNIEILQQLNYLKGEFKSSYFLKLKGYKLILLQRIVS